MDANLNLAKISGNDMDMENKCEEKISEAGNNNPKKVISDWSNLIGDVRRRKVFGMRI